MHSQQGCIGQVNKVDKLVKCKIGSGQVNEVDKIEDSVERYKHASSRMLVSDLMLISPFKYIILGGLQHYLIDEAAILVANVLLSNRLGYCNSQFRSLSSLNMRNLMG